MTYSSILAAVAVTLGLNGASFAATPSTAVLDLTTISTADAVAAVEQQSGGRVVEIDLRDQNGRPAYHVSAIAADGSQITFLVDGRTGKVKSTTGSQASVTSDATEAGEGPNDADSGNEDAN